VATEPKTLLYGISNAPANGGSNYSNVYLTPADQQELNRLQALDQAKKASTTKKPGILDILNGIGTAAGSVIGLIGASKQQVPPYATNPYLYAPPVAEPKKDYTIWIVLAAVVVVLVTVIVLFVNKKPK
jgi:hypothetical protein